MRKLLKDSARKAMFAKKAIVELDNYGQHSPLYEEWTNNAGIDVSPFGRYSNKVIRQKLVSHHNKNTNHNILFSEDRDFKKGCSRCGHKTLDYGRRDVVRGKRLRLCSSCAKR